MTMRKIGKRSKFRWRTLPAAATVCCRRGVRFSDSSRTSTMTKASSPDSDDDTCDHDTFSNFHVVPCNPNLGFDLEAQQGEVNGLSASKPLYSKELCQIFLEYQKLIQGPAEKDKRSASPDNSKPYIHIPCSLSLH